MLGKNVRAKGKTCQCSGGIEVEIQGTVIKEIDAVNGKWLMLDTPNGTQTVKAETVFEVLP